MGRKKKEEPEIYHTPFGTTIRNPYPEIDPVPYVAPPSWVYEPSLTSTPWTTTSTTLRDFDWKDHPDLIDRFMPEVKEVKAVSSTEKTPEGTAHMVTCRDKDNLSAENILKNLSAIKGKLMLDIAPIHIKHIECYMTPTVKDNIVKASKRLKMYGKKRPIIARFDEYGRRLPDEITIDTMEGMTVHIVDPESYGEFYFALRAVEFPTSTYTTTNWGTGGYVLSGDIFTDDVPF